MITGLHFLIFIPGVVAMSAFVFANRRHLGADLDALILGRDLVRALIDGLIVLIDATVYMQMLQIKEGDDASDLSRVFG